MLPIAIMDDNGRLWPLEAILDTGFVGELSLPHNVISRLGLSQAGNLNFVLANGEPTRLRTYHGRVFWHEQLLDIVVTQTGDAPLVGIKLLSGSRITMDIFPGGDVLIEETSSP